MAGIEPAASCTQDRSSTADLHSGIKRRSKASDADTPLFAYPPHGADPGSRAGCRFRQLCLLHLAGHQSIRTLSHRIWSPVYLRRSDPEITHPRMFVPTVWAWPHQERRLHGCLHWPGSGRWTCTTDTPAYEAGALLPELSRCCSLFANREDFAISSKFAAPR